MSDKTNVRIETEVWGFPVIIDVSKDGCFATMLLRDGGVHCELKPDALFNTAALKRDLRTVVNVAGDTDGS